MEDGMYGKAGREEWEAGNESDRTVETMDSRQR